MPRREDTRIALRNGTEERAELIRMTMERLRALHQVPEERALLNTLLYLAHDPDYDVPAEHQTRLRNLVMFPMGGSVRNVILSALHGHGTNMTIVEPAVDGSVVN